MALEVADYISELISSNPTVADPVSQGDDHIRLLKQVLQNALPGNDAPLTFTGDMTLNGDYNGTNAVMTGNVSGVNGAFSGPVSGTDGTFSGTVQGGTVTDGVYDLNAVGTIVDRIDAYGSIVTAVTVYGVGVIGVTQVTTGEWNVDWSTIATGPDKQAVFVSGDNQAVGAGGFYLNTQYHSGTGVGKIYGTSQAGDQTVPTTKFPIDFLRFVFP